MKISIKLRVFSDRSFERSHAEEWGWQQWGGEQQRGGEGGGVGAIVGVSSTSKNRP